MEYYGWEHLSAVKEATTKGGGVSSSRRKAYKPKGNRSQDNWEENLLAISNSKPSSEDW
jgi:hypothetical protein